MERYDSYKNSHIDWVQDIPKHWSKNKFKFLFYEKKSTSNPSLNSGSISFGEVIYKDDESIPESTKLSYQEVLKGEFLINPLNLNYDLKSLRISKSKINVVVSQGYIVLNLISDDNPDFFKYLLRDFDIRHLKSLGSGVRQTISFTHLKSEELPLPPLSEQSQIVQFLDEKTSLIDSLIEKTKRKIELLKEERTSLINHTVTKGLNPNVELKDSGVEWIGEIPRGWERIPFKYEIDVLTDYTSNGSFKSLSENVEYLKEGYSRLVRLTDLRVNLINDGIYVSEVSHNFLKKSELFGGEILISCVGHYTGFVTKMLFGKGKCTLGPNMYLIRNKDVSSDVNYLVYLLNSDLIQSGLKNGINKTTQEKINKDNVKDLQIIRPPLSEQEEIVQFLDEKTSTIDKTIELEGKRIDYLKEYRQSLISEVVTGKIKVITDE